MARYMNNEQSRNVERLFIGTGANASFADAFREVARRVPWADGALIASMIGEYSKKSITFYFFYVRKNRTYCTPDRETE